MFTTDICVYFLCKSLVTKVKLSEVRLKNGVCVCVLDYHEDVVSIFFDNKLFMFKLSFLLMTTVFSHSSPARISLCSFPVCHCFVLSNFVTVVCHHSCGLLGSSQTNMCTRH